MGRRCRRSGSPPRRTRARSASTPRQQRRPSRGSTRRRWLPGRPAARTRPADHLVDADGRQIPAAQLTLEQGVPGRLLDSVAAPRGCIIFRGILTTFPRQADATHAPAIRCHRQTPRRDAPGGPHAAGGVLRQPAVLQPRDGAAVRDDVDLRGAHRSRSSGPGSSSCARCSAKASSSRGAPADA